MKNSSRIYRVPFCLLIAAGLLLSGCSDSSVPEANEKSIEAPSESASTSTPDTTSENDPDIAAEIASEMAQEILPLRGTLIISESSGKRILDAWFSRSLYIEIQRELLWSDSQNVCFKSDNNGDAPQLNLLSSRKFERAVDSINITSRAGNYVTLLPQQLGDSVVYASDALWQDDGLPEDALLSLSVAQGDTPDQGIRLSPLSPIERLSPENGQLVQSDSAIRWQIVPESEALVLLQITALSKEESVDSSPALQSVQCQLDDDGSFDLPDAIRDALGNPLYISVAVSRYREQFVSGVDGDLHIVQRSQN